MPRVTITVPDRTPQPYRFQLDRRTVTLGRGSENDIAIDCSSVSVKHAEMVRVEGGYEIRDLGSTNGTKLDEQRRMTIPLVDDTTVHLGDVAFYFQLSEEEQAALNEEAPAQSQIVKEPREERERTMAGASATGGSGVTMFLLFVILAAGAFFAGLAIRHQKDTGRSLIGDLGKKPAKEAPATPAADGAVTPAPAPDAAAPTEPGK